jgi:uncharacterized membrane protein
VNGKTGRRFREVDAARGVALPMMVLCHPVYCVDKVRRVRDRVGPGFWVPSGRFSARGPAVGCT